MSKNIMVLEGFGDHNLITERLIQPNVEKATRLFDFLGVCPSRTSLLGLPYAPRPQRRLSLPSQRGAYGKPGRLVRLGQTPKKSKNACIPCGSASCYIPGHNCNKVEKSKKLDGFKAFFVETRKCTIRSPLGGQRMPSLKAGSVW